MCPRETIFASNTSTLPITSLAESFKDQGKFVGIHFFSPVEKMMLVEIIRGKATGERALAVDGTHNPFTRAVSRLMYFGIVRGTDGAGNVSGNLSSAPLRIEVFQIDLNARF